MKNLMILLLLISGCSSYQEEPTPEITGCWIAVPWYCNNPELCDVSAQDKTAVLFFEINEKLSYSILPNNNIKINWLNGFVFKGKIIDSLRMKGVVLYEEVIWNDSVELQNCHLL